MKREYIDPDGKKHEINEIELVKMTYLINMREKYGEILNIRSEAETIFDNVPHGMREVILDFEGITFMGRAFTQEYYRQTLKHDFKVIEINKKDNIEKMINIVFKRSNERITMNEKSNYLGKTKKNSRRE